MAFNHSSVGVSCEVEVETIQITIHQPREARYKRSPKCDSWIPLGSRKRRDLLGKLGVRGNDLVGDREMENNERDILMWSKLGVSQKSGTRKIFSNLQIIIF